MVPSVVASEIPKVSVLDFRTSYEPKHSIHTKEKVTKVTLNLSQWRARIIRRSTNKLDNVTLILSKYLGLPMRNS